MWHQTQLMYPCGADNWKISSNFQLHLMSEWSHSPHMTVASLQIVLPFFGPAFLLNLWSFSCLCKLGIFGLFCALLSWKKPIPFFFAQTIVSCYWEICFHAIVRCLIASLHLCISLHINYIVLKDICIHIYKSLQPKEHLFEEEK